jgi:hypothetical protein
MRSTGSLLRLWVIRGYEYEYEYEHENEYGFMCSSES